MIDQFTIRPRYCRKVLGVTNYQDSLNFYRFDVHYTGNGYIKKYTSMAFDSAQVRDDARKVIVEMFNR